MGRRGLILVLVVVLVGGGLALGALWFASQQQTGGGGPVVEPTVTPTPAPTAEPMIPVVIAIQPLQRGDKVVTGTYDLAPWPESSVNNLPVFITDTADLENKVLRVPVFQGEPILRTMLVADLTNESYGSDIAAQIPAGRVAISVPYDKYHGVASGLRAGDHINILVTWAIVDIDQSFQTILPNISSIVAPPNPAGELQGLVPSNISWVNVERVANSSLIPSFPAYFGRGEDGVNLADDFYVVPSEPQRPRYVSQNILQDLIILNVGDFKEDAPLFVPQPTSAPAEPGPDGSTPTPVPAQAPEPTPTAVPPSTVTLLASPQDALVLEFLTRQMERYPTSVLMTMVLRSAKDNNVAQAATDSVTLQYMFETYNIALPAKLNYGPNGNQFIITTTVATRNLAP